MLNDREAGRNPESPPFRGQLFQVAVPKNARPLLTPVGGKTKQQVDAFE